MIKNYFLGVVLGSLLVVSCSQGPTTYESMPYRKSHGIAKSTITFETISLDSAYVSGECSSGVTLDGNIYLYDNYFAWIYNFSPDGSLLNRKLGFGRGPKESLIKRSTSFALNPDGGFAIYGPSLDFENFGADYKRINRFRLKQGAQMSSSPDDFLSYCEPVIDVVSRVYDGKFYIGLTSDNPEFSYLYTNSEYIDNSYRIGVIDLVEGMKVSPEIKGFPAFYKKDPFKYTSFDCVDFDFDEKGDLFIGFKADSLIYIFDKDREPKYSFGRAGKNMDMSYSRISNDDDIEKWMPNLENKGYYGWIEYIDETGLCFRSYRKGSASESDGLQVYDKKGNLIYDVDTPKNLKVVGYIEPFYYSQVYIEDDASLSVVRFRL